MNLSVGRGNGFALGFARRGVTTNTNSVRSAWNALLRNKTPSIGISPKIGNAFTASVTLLLISPPMAKLSPSRNCTVVDARLVEMEGRTLVCPVPVVTVVPTCDNSDTSGVTRKFINPSSSTVGTNFKPTPYSRSSKTIERHDLNLSGINFGIGLGYQF